MEEEIKRKAKKEEDKKLYLSKRSERIMDEIINSEYENEEKRITKSQHDKLRKRK